MIYLLLANHAINKILLLEVKLKDIIKLFDEVYLPKIMKILDEI